MKATYTAVIQLRDEMLELRRLLVAEEKTLSG
jgi:hypothetical protein